MAWKFTAKNIFRLLGSKYMIIELQKQCIMFKYKVRAKKKKQKKKPKLNPKHGFFELVVIGTGNYGTTKLF